MQKQYVSAYQKALVSYLYFIQGIFLVMPSTTILTYKSMPSYGILSLFSAAALPFSFKFISAPLIQKYTFKRYGRRKTWVVLSLIFGSLFLFCSSLFTLEQQTAQKYLAFFLTLSIFMISLEDISTDALAVKQLNSAELASYLQCVMQSIGGLFGSLIFFQLVSGNWFSMQKPLLTVPEFFKYFALVTFVSALIIHLTYKQKRSKQQDTSDHTLWQVIKHYKYFVIPKYKPCRQAITFVLYIHGLVYFSSSCTVQLIKNNHISKDLITTLSNVNAFFIFFIASILKKYWPHNHLIHKRTRIILGLRLALMMLFFFINVTNIYLICTIFLILGMFSSAQFFLNSLICNSFHESKFSGMYVSMMGSFLNFGNNSAIQQKIINYTGYYPAVITGFIYTIFVLLTFGYVQEWIKKGIKQQDMEAQKTIKSKLSKTQ